MQKCLDSAPVKVSIAQFSGIGMGALLATTIFSSAFLLFQVQPLISKFILPWFGGSPAVWTTSMLFFQCMLFCGYLYSHLTSRHLNPRQQSWLHIGLLLVASAMACFVIPMDFLKPRGDENPTLQILLLLGICVGIPYFALSTTGPLIQAWFSRAYPGASPYRLFALSNFGSLLALSSFPFLFEPWLELPTMGRFWMVGFWVFAAICIWSAARMLQLHSQERQRATPTESQAAERPPLWQRSAWIGLPAIASLVFIATSNQVCHNVAPTPFLWIIPLALYLLTFVICFDHERWYLRGVVGSLCALGILALVGYSYLENWLWDNLVYSEIGSTWQSWFSRSSKDGLLHCDIGLSYVQRLALTFTTMFLMCLACHGELVRLRPREVKYLTEFYLMISGGGALGGLFICFIATNFFDDYYEWQIGLVVCFLIACAVVGQQLLRKLNSGPSDSLAARCLIGLGALAASTGLCYLLDPFPAAGDESTADCTTRQLYKARNFFGKVTAYEDVFHRTIPAEHNGGAARGPRDSNRQFFSGGVLHGKQLIDLERRNTPIAYFHKDSGSGQIMNYVLSKYPDRPIKYAVVGLGVGTLAAFARGADESRAADECVMYEINPLVETIARDCFWYLSDYETRSGKKLDVRLGDGRLTMEQEAPQHYDIIFLDAFSGGSVPAHLLTREGFEIYKKHLRKKADGSLDGYICVNITNSYLNLYPVVKNAAEQVMRMNYTSVYMESNWEEFAQRSHYFIMSNDEECLRKIPVIPRYKTASNLAKGKEEQSVYSYDVQGIPLWTDHYSNLFQILLPR